jgi:hypothetical protein
MRVEPAHLPMSAEEQAKWLGEMEREIEALMAFLLSAFPETTEEQRRALWAVIRLRVILKKLKAAHRGAPTHARA